MPDGGTLVDGHTLHNAVMITINLPPQLRAFTGGQKTLRVQAATLAEAFHRLDEVSPMLRPQIFDPAGNVRRFVGVFLDDQQMVELEAGSQPLADGSTITIVMAVAGG